MGVGAVIWARGLSVSSLLLALLQFDWFISSAERRILLMMTPKSSVRTLKSLSTPLSVVAVNMLLSNAVMLICVKLCGSEYLNALKSHHY